MRNKFDIRWDNTFDIVKEFVMEFGRFPTSSEKFKGIDVGHWCYKQRDIFKNGKLKQWRIDKLESIDFPFNIKSPTCIKHNKKWEQTFNLMVEFKDEYGRLPYSFETFKHVNLGTWCAYQRVRNKKNLLEQSRIDALNSIGFIWDLDEYLWMCKYNLLKEYIEEFGKQPSVRTVYKDVNLGAWCMVQRGCDRGYFKGKLTEERVQLLDKINFRWL